MRAREIRISSQGYGGETPKKKKLARSESVISKVKTIPKSIFDSQGKLNG